MRVDHGHGDVSVTITGNAGQTPGAAALAGFFLFVFSAVALSGPGRIDIVDGQSRYEVARSLVDHGDHVIRDPNVWFGIAPGRDGQLFARYRFPHSAAGVVAIGLADATGPVSEGRRHFFFTLIGAVACAVTAVAYAVWFGRRGHGMRAALGWAAAGIFCTPNWYYGTSTFDDILGAAALVVALVVAHECRAGRPVAGAAMAGLAMAVAFNCKPPLGIFVLPVLAATLDPLLSPRQQSVRIASVVGGLLVGVAAYIGYDLYKFPPGSAWESGATEIPSVWSTVPFAGLPALLFSVRASALLYSPTLVLGLAGAVWWVRRERAFAAAALCAAALFTLFISSLSFYKGDPSWGPRYLTPVFAALWLFTRAGASLTRRGTVVLLLAGGAVVQVLGLSVDPQRLDLRLGLPARIYAEPAGLYFHPSTSHLLQRPEEIAGIMRAEGRADAYTPAPGPTFATPALPLPEARAAVERYHVFRSFRPWWISQRYLEPEARPVALLPAVVLLFLAMVLGFAVAVFATRAGTISSLEGVGQWPPQR